MGPFPFSDIPDVVLDNPPVAYTIDVADKLNADCLPLFCFQGQIFIPDIPVSFQLCERFSGKVFILEKSQLPELSADKIRKRVAQHIDDKRVRIDDFSGIPVKDQNTVLCRFKKTAVPSGG